MPPRLLSFIFVTALVLGCADSHQRIVSAAPPPTVTHGALGTMRLSVDGHPVHHTYANPGGAMVFDATLRRTAPGPCFTDFTFVGGTYAMMGEGIPAAGQCWFGETEDGHELVVELYRPQGTRPLPDLPLAMDERVRVVVPTEAPFGFRLFGEHGGAVAVAQYDPRFDDDVPETQPTFTGHPDGAIGFRFEGGCEGDERTLYATLDGADVALTDLGVEARAQMPCGSVDALGAMLTWATPGAGLPGFAPSALLDPPVR